MSVSSAPLLEFRKVSKQFQTQMVLQDLDLQIRSGEFFTLLGPSGCGKTTVLRLIAGLESPDQGEVWLDGENITAIPAEKRHINTVFQSYALFPHMTVSENIGFGLKMAGCSRSEIQGRVRETLERVQLGELGDRRPDQLSGGQKQRVAIARALVNQPRVLLLDECLSALDYKLRVQMQNELKQLQRQLGITFVYVTHDQEEALSLSDRIAVLQSGQARQIGTPRQIYETPNHLFVARFIGDANVFDAQVLRDLGGNRFEVRFEDDSCREVHARQALHTGAHIHVMLRPEDMRIYPLPDNRGSSGFRGQILERNYTGKTLDSLIQLDNGHQITASEFFDEDDPDFDYSIAEPVWVDWVHGWEHIILKDAPF